MGLAGNNDIVDIVKKALCGDGENVYGKKEELVIEGDRMLTTPLLHRIYKDRRGLRQLLYILRHSGDTRQIPQQIHAGYTV